MKKLTKLILTLEKSEKRYFTRYVGLYSNEKTQDYLKIYNIINRNIEEDQAKIDSKIKEANIKNASIKASYLYDLILDALVDYSNKKEIEFKLYNKLKKVSILKGKGLFNEAASILKKLKQQALQYENIPIYLRAVQLEFGLSSEKVGVKDRDFITPHYTEIKKYCNALAKKAELYIFGNQVRELFKQTGNSTSKYANKVLENPLLKLNKNYLLKSVESGIYNLKSYVLLNQEPTDWKAWNDILHLQTQLVLEKEPNLFSDEIKLSALNNLAFSSFICCNNAYLNTTLQLAKEMTFTKKLHQNSLSIIEIYTQIFIHLLKPPVKKPLIFIKAAEKMYAKYEKPALASYKMFFMDALLNYCIINQCYDSATPWLKKQKPYIFEQNDYDYTIQFLILRIITLIEIKKSSQIEGCLKTLAQNVENHYSNDDFLKEVIAYFEAQKTKQPCPKSYLSTQKLYNLSMQQDQNKLKILNLHVVQRWLQNKLAKQ